MIGMDASVLTLVLNPESRPPLHPETKQPILRAKERVDYLLSQLHETKQKVAIPTPVLSEVLVRTGKSGLQYIHVLWKAEVFDIRDFDRVSAIELAEMNRKVALNESDFRREAPYQKIKVDRQIVSICKIAGVHTIYACDKSLSNFASRFGIKVVGVHELDLPPEPEKSPQMDIFGVIEAQQNNFGGAEIDRPDLNDEEDDGH